MLDYYTDRFEREYGEAKEEFVRLSHLFKEVCWYNFETACRTWRQPWRFTDPDSTVSVDCMQFTRKWERGCLMEYGRFPVWYEGPVRDAPPLPPEIVLHELRDAREYMLACQKQISAPYDWAPGGKCYEELCRVTSVGRPCQCVESNKRKFSSSEAV